MITSPLLRLSFLSGFFLLLIAVSACKKNDNTKLPPNKGTLILHFQSSIGNQKIVADSVYRNADSTQLKFQTAQFFMCKFKVQEADSSWHVFDGYYIMKSLTNSEFVLGDIPVGDYINLAFKVGVDTSSNHLSPTSFPPSSPLYVTNLTTWFGNTNDGYIFMNVQGQADTSATLNGTPSANFSYQIGEDSLLKQIDMPGHFNIAFQDKTILNINCDFGVLLNGINFKTQTNATPYFNTSLENLLATRIHTMFSYQ